MTISSRHNRNEVASEYANLKRNSIKVIARLLFSNLSLFTSFLPKMEGQEGNSFGFQPLGAIP